MAKQDFATQLAGIKEKHLVEVKGVSSDVAKDQVTKELAAAKGVSHTKADEVMYSTNTNAGAELIPDSVTTNRVIDLIAEESGLLSTLAPGRVESALLSKNSEVHIAGRNDRFLLNDEWTTGPYRPNTPDRQVYTDKVTLAQKSLGASEGVSEYLDTYSVADLESLISTKLARKAMRTIEDIVINGDDSAGATGNINSDDQAATVGLPGGAADALYGFTDSLRFETVNPAAIAGTDNTDVAGAIQVSDLFSALAKFRYNAGGLLENGLFAVMDRGSFYTLCNDENFRDVAINGASSSVTNPDVFTFRGVTIIVSDQIRPTTANGRINTLAPAGNTQGQVIVGRTNVIQHGFGRELEIQMSSNSLRQGIIVEGLMHFGMASINKLGGYPEPSIHTLYNIDTL